MSLSKFCTVLLVAGLRVFFFTWEKEYFGVILLTRPHSPLRKVAFAGRIFSLWIFCYEHDSIFIRGIEL